MQGFSQPRCQLPLPRCIALNSHDLVVAKFGVSIAPLLLEGTGSTMNINVQERVGEQKAAVLLGLPAMELRRYSRVSGLGHLEHGDRGDEMVFTYDELQRLCLLAAQSSK